MPREFFENILPSISGDAILGMGAVELQVGTETVKEDDVNMGMYEDELMVGSSQLLDPTLASLVFVV